jgi:two-component system alkaline phosphatase synthesis response regulator PhoP
MAEKILVVDDEEGIVEFIEINLRRAGFDVIKGYNGHEALRKVKEDNPDLVVLDVMMPLLDGFEVCKEVRRFSDVPIIMLTAKTEDRDKISGLEMGADDYIPKPFNPEELIARIQAILRRLSAIRAHRETPQKLISFGDLSIDTGGKKVLRDGSPLALTPREFDLLHYFASNPGRIFTKDEIRTGVWGSEFIEERSIDVHIRQLREKIGDDSVDPQYILTVWGVGYKANPKPTMKEQS